MNGLSLGFSAPMLEGVEGGEGDGEVEVEVRRRAVKNSANVAPKLQRSMAGAL